MEKVYEDAGGSLRPASGKPQAASAMGAAALRPAAPVPHDRRLGLLGLVRALRSNPITAFASEAYEKPIVRLGRLGRVLLVSDPQCIEQILVGNAANYRKGLQQQRRLKPALGNGLLTAEGEDWRDTRRAMAPLFNPRATGALIGDMNRAAGAMRERWLSRVDEDTPLDLSAEFQRLTYEIISLTMFSGELDKERLRIHESMAVYFDTLGRLDLASVFNLPAWLSLVAHRRARPALGVFRGSVDRLIGGRAGSGGGHGDDLLDQLIGLLDSDGRSSAGRTSIADNVLTFLAAGHETTGNALTWIVYLLSLYPKVRQSVVEELEIVCAGSTPSRDRIAELVYTRAVIAEAMRLYPPAPFMGREAIGADELDDIKVAAGTQIVISPWVVHRHRRLWANPDAFRPERFLSGRSGAIAKGAYIPFGLGPRICIGQGFAMQEIIVVLATILPLFDFDLVRPLDVFPQARITLRPMGGLPAIVRAKKHD